MLAAFAALHFVSLYHYIGVLLLALRSSLFYKIYIV